MSEAVIGLIIGFFIGMLITDTIAIAILCHKVAKLEAEKKIYIAFLQTGSGGERQ